jgi:preprotein translocase subunit SecG
MQTILVVFHVLIAFGLVGLILIQHGKGADAGAAFGAGASGTVFGAQGAGSFLTRTTAILATLFFLTSMALGYYASQSTEPADLMEGLAEPPVQPTVVPVAPESEVPALQDEQAGADEEVPAAPVSEAEVIEVIEESPEIPDMPGEQGAAEAVPDGGQPNSVPAALQ